jgi:hypothetical protein
VALDTNAIPTSSSPAPVYQFPPQVAPVPPGPSNPLLAKWAQEETARRDAIRRMAAQYSNPFMGVDQSSPDYTTGRNANPEDYVPYDPVTGRPNYRED